MSNLPRELRRRLDSLAWMLRGIRTARGIALWAAASGAILSTVLLVLCRVEPSVSEQAILKGTVTVLMGASLAAGLLLTVFWPVTPRRLALMIERKFPDLQDRLLAAIDPATVPGREGQSPLALALADDLSRVLSGRKLSHALDLQGARRVSLAALPCVLTALLISLSCPTSLARLLNPPAPAAPVAAEEAPAEASRPLATPGIWDLAVTVTPPSYSGLPVRRLTDGFEQLRVLRGTRITISARHTKRAVASIQLAGREPTVVAARDDQITYGFTPNSSTEWSLLIAAGEQSAGAGPFEVQVYRDKNPGLRIVAPGRDLTLDSPRPVHLAIEATDDFGLASASLLYRRGEEGAWQSLPIATGGKTLSYSADWDLAPMGLRPGDSVHYKASVTDNDAITGPKTATSRMYRITIPQPEPMAPTPEAVEQVQQAEADALEQLKAEAEAFDEQLRELVQRAQMAQESGGEMQLSRADLQEAQRRLETRAEAVQDAMARAEQSLSESPLITDDLVQKVQELHQLMQELMNEDLKRVMDELQKAMEQTQPRDMVMSLERAREAQKEFLEKLDRTIELLRKAQLEAKLEALKQFVEQLVQRQESLRERTSTMQEGERSDSALREQRELAEKTDTVGKTIRDVGEEMQKQSEDIAADLRNLAADIDEQDPAGQMRESAAQMHEGQPQRSMRPQKRAIQALRDAAAGLSGAAADLTAAERREMTQAAAKITRDILTLSRGQEEAMDKLRPMAMRGRVDVTEQKGQLTDLKRRQQAVRKGTEGLAAKMRDLAKQTPIMKPETAMKADRLSREMAQAASEIEAGQVLQAFSREGQNVAALNELAREMMDLAGELSQASAQKSLQEYMKRMEELAQRQKSINEQTQGDGPPQQPGGEPSGQPGDGPPMPQPQGSGQLSMEQAMVREALQKLLKGKDGGKLADQLGGMPGLMEQVEDDLRGANVTQQTLEHQREILHKMLDAQRSLYSKQKESKERKAEAPKPYEPPKTPPVLRPDQLRPPKLQRQRREFTPEELPLDFEEITRKYLDKIGR